VVGAWPLGKSLGPEGSTLLRGLMLLYKALVGVGVLCKPFSLVRTHAHSCLPLYLLSCKDTAKDLTRYRMLAPDLGLPASRTTRIKHSMVFCYSSSNEVRHTCSDQAWLDFIPHRNMIFYPLTFLSQPIANMTIKVFINKHLHWPCFNRAPKL
jgi:hypothetical protein